ncbi:MAG: hypothetical protein ACREEK_31135 [Bradyrhizobium sp.]
MRRLIESLTPNGPHHYWRWVAGMFSVYVVLLVGAAGAFISHESTRNLRHEPAATVAAKGNRAPAQQASMPMSTQANFD